MFKSKTNSNTPKESVSNSQPTIGSPLSAAMQIMRRSLMPITLYAGIACAGVSIAIFGCMLSQIQHDLTMSAAMAGICQALFFTGHLGGAILTGRLMGSFSTRKVWILGLSATVAGSVLTGVPSLPILMAGRMLAGFGLASSVLFASAVLATMYPKRMGSMLNFMHAVIAAAAALTLMIGQPLGDLLGDWTSVLWFCAIVGSAPLLLAAMVPGTPELKSDNKAGIGELKKAMLNPLLLPILPAIIGYVAIEQAITVFLPQLIETRFAVAGATAANLTGMLWLGIIFGRMGSVFIGERIHESVQLIVGGVGMGLCMMMTLVVPELNMIPLLVFAAGVAGGPMVPLAFAIAAKRMQRARNSAMTVCQMACCAGGIYGPLMAGTVGGTVTLNLALMFGFATVIIAVIPLIRALPTQDRLDAINARRQTDPS